jgi:hypothetical protein
MVVVVIVAVVLHGADGVRRPVGTAPENGGQRQQGRKKKRKKAGSLHKWYLLKKKFSKRKLVAHQFANQHLQGPDAAKNAVGKPVAEANPPGELSIKSSNKLNSKACQADNFLDLEKIFRERHRSSSASGKRGGHPPRFPGQRIGRAPAKKNAWKHLSSIELRTGFARNLRRYLKKILRRWACGGRTGGVLYRNQTARNLLPSFQ